ncbi:MAG: hypothetical protein HY914_07135 [Desulfomonile tiedjei]|nr:hypothetical protein [Desulfomonile tiedjei]
MKYLAIIAFWLVVGALVVKFVLKADPSREMGTLLARVRDRGHRVHKAVGLVAVLVLLILLVRLIVQLVRLW